MSLISELKRRNVFRVAIAYGVVAWLLLQVGDTLAPALHLPEWINSALAFFLLLGFPIAVLFAWAFELTPEGIKLERNVDRALSVTPQTGRKLDFIIISLLALAVIFLGFDKWVLDPSRDAEMTRQAAIEAKQVAADDSAITVSTEHPAVSQPTSGESDTAANTGGLRPQSSGVSAARTGPSIAVLPFTNMSTDEDYFADGLSEELLNLLANLPGLKVAGRTSAFSFKGKNEDLRTIGAALGVNHVLEGSVRRSGDRLRITAQLIKVEDGFHLWSQTYDRQMADIFDIQDELASAITQALKIQLVPRDHRPTQNIEAYRMYLQALGLMGRDAVINTIEAVQQAIQIDPDFYDAYAFLAGLYWLGGGVAMSPEDSQPKVFEYASKALALKPDMLMAQALVASSVPTGFSLWNEDQAMRAVFEAEPNSVQIHYLYTWNLMRYGYFQEAQQHATRLVELEPLAETSYEYLGQTLISLGRIDEALDAWQRCKDLDGTEYCSELAAVSLLISGRDDEVPSWLADHSRIGRGDAANVAAFIASARNEDTGVSFLQEYIENRPVTGLNGYKSPYAYIWLLAFGYVDDYWKALRARQGGRISWTDGENLEQVGTIMRESGFTARPDYMEQVALIGIDQFWDQRGPPDHCQKLEGRWQCQ